MCVCAWMGWGRLGEGGIKGTEREREKEGEATLHDC